MDSNRPYASSADSQAPPVGGDSAAADPVSAGSAASARPAPMTFSLLGRFFGVPLLIIASIVGGAVLVVLLFGGPATPQQRSVNDLLDALEASSGERSMGLLLTREKALWQMALELSLRLEEKDQRARLTDAQLQTVARRLGGIVESELAAFGQVVDEGEQSATQRDLRGRRLEFAIHALGRTDRPEAVPPLLRVLESGRERFASVAMREFGELHELPDARRSIGPILSLVSTSKRPETLLIGTTVLSVLGEPRDQKVIEALARVRLEHPGEVAWSASLALARLGSAAGKSTLLDLLDRSFLESGDRYIATGPPGSGKRYPLPPGRVEGLLLAAMDAGAHLDDPEIWQMIERLQTDASPAVRGRAIALVDARNG